MKLRFYRCWYNDSKKDSTLARAMSLESTNEEWERKWQDEWKKDTPDQALTSAMARENALARPYSTYLASSLESDFQDPAHCDLVLQKIAQIEAGEIKEYTDGGDGFYHYIKPDSVTFEHYVFNECPEWPLWSCGLAQYKAALQGWKKFIQMSLDINSEVIIELPDDDSSHFPKL